MIDHDSFQTLAKWNVQVTTKRLILGVLAPGTAMLNLRWLPAGAVTAWMIQLTHATIYT